MSTRPTLQPSVPRRAAAALLVLLMIIGGFAVWIGVPLLWLWVASQLTSGTSPSFGPYMLVAIAVPVSMYVIVRMLRRVDHWHRQLIGRDEPVRIQAVWLKSMRAERETRRPTTALDLVMVGTAACAVLAMAVWFIVAAGNPLPQ